MNPADLVARLLGRGYGASLVGSAGRVFAANVAGVGLVFLVQVLLARTMGTIEYGVYAYTLAWLGALLLLATGGLDTASVRYVAEYVAKRDWAALAGYLRFSRITLLVVATLTSVALGAVALMAPGMAPNLRSAFLLGCSLLPLNAFLALQCSSLQGLKRTVTSHVLQSIVRPLALLALVGVLLLGSMGLDANVALLANLGGGLATMLASGWLLRRALPPEVAKAVPEARSLEWRSTALPIFLVGGSQLLLLQSDVLMVGALRGTTEAGLYAVASRLATLVGFGISAANNVLAPVISDLYSQEKLDELGRVTRLASRGMLAFAAPATLVLAATGKPLLGLFGKDFEAAYVPLVILALAQLLIALNGPGGFLLTMTGNQRAAAWTIGGCALLGLVLNAAFIPIWGATGAAIATCTAFGLRTLLVGRMVRRLTGVRTGFL